jgi:hypothetical protein
VTRFGWWIHRHAASLTYLLIVVLVAALLTIATVAGGWR